MHINAVSTSASVYIYMNMYVRSFKYETAQF